jgi:two-component system NtrC family sensor kinase
VRTRTGERALGTRVSEEVYDAVLLRGETWRDRAFVVNDWYISAYEPIRNYNGDIIGMLYVGLLEKAVTSVRDKVILTFVGIALVGFILIVAITYYMVHSITRPIKEMAAAAQSFAAGNLDQEVRSTSEDEIGLLATSFNQMLASVRDMKARLEEWGKTLEEKVKERTEELVEMQAKMAQADKLASLGKLSAGVAHEINNPLGSILTLTALTLEDMKEDDPDRENLEEVITQTKRCRDIVKGLLEFSRQSDLKTEPVNINRVLVNTLSLLGGQALLMNVNVIRQFKPDLPDVMGDESQLQQVFTNIILNGVEAMEEAGTLSVETRHNTAGELVEIVISDTGCGISTDKMDRIFDPFFTSKASGDGTGLGLSIAYGIITKHRGTISVESEVGKGSSFTIRIPAESDMERDA